MSLPEIYQHVSGLLNRDEIDAWLSSNYHKLENGGLEYIGQEPNTDSPEKFKTAAVRVLVVRLSTYLAVDASMTHSLLGQILHDGRREDVFVDFCFLPPKKDYETFVAKHIPLWFGTTSKHPARDFDWIVLSHSVCMERVNLPAVLKYSGIPLFKKARMADKECPLILMGGANSPAVEDLYGSLDGTEENSCMVDATVVGAGEISLRQARDKMIDGLQNKLSKEQILRSMHGAVYGFYEPDLYEVTYGPLDKPGSPNVIKKIARKVDYAALPVIKAKVQNLNKVRTLEEGLVFYSGGVGGAADVEISRGCPAQCSFCVDESTLVATNRGMIKIGDISSSGDQCQDVSGVDIRTLGGPERVTRFFRLGKKKGLKITSDAGFVIRCSEDHELKTAQSRVGAQFDFREARKLSVGEDYLAVPLSEGVFPKERVKFGPLVKKVESDFVGSRGHRENKTIALPTGELNSDWAEFFGLIMGDGHYQSYSYKMKSGHMRNTWQFTLSVGEGVDKGYLESLYSRLGLNPRRHYTKDSVEVFQIEDKRFRRFMKELGFDFVTAREKTIPWSILCSPKEEQLAFLRGYFAADGFMDLKGRVLLFGTVSKMLAEQLQVVFTNFGCKSRISYNERAGLSRVYLTPWYASRFVDHGFSLDGVSPEKQDALVQLLKFGSLDQASLVDGQEVYFDRVVSIEKMEIEAVDLTVVPSHTMIVNGILTHQCMENWVNKPYTERDMENVIDAAKKARILQGAHEANLYSFNWNHYSKIYDLVAHLMKEMGSVNLISNRLDVQAQDAGLATLTKVAASGSAGSSTLGIEGVSERMRKFLHKSVTEAQIYAGMRYLMEAGMGELKAFMICTGYEKQEDIWEMCALIRRVTQMKKENGYTTNTRVSFMPLFSCAGTPLQFFSCESSLRIAERSLDFVVRACRVSGWGFRTSAKKSEVEIAQLLELADRRIAPLVLKSSIEDGYIFYGMLPKTLRDIWATRMVEVGLTWEQFFREKHVSEMFPWEHLSFGVAKEFLWERYEEALTYVDDGYCLGMHNRKGKCGGCKGCHTTNQVKAITSRALSAPISSEDLRASRRDMTNLAPVRFLVDVTEDAFRVVPKRFFYQSIPRALMMADPDLSTAYLSVRGHSRITASVNEQKDWVYGRMLIDVAFNNMLVTEDRLRALLPKINSYLHGHHIVDVRSGARRQIRSDVEFCLAQVDFFAAASPSYSTVTQAVSHYADRISSAGEARIRKDSVVRIDLMSRKGAPVRTLTYEELVALGEGNDVSVTWYASPTDEVVSVIRGKVGSVSENSVVVRSGGLRIKRKVTQMKGMFRTVEVDLDSSRIVMVDASFVDKGTRLTFLADNRLNAYALLETLLGGKQWQYRPYPVKILGYFNRPAELKGEVTVNLWDVLKTGGAVSCACKCCGGPIEEDAFTGKDYVSVVTPGYCLACDYENGAAGK